MADPEHVRRLLEGPTVWNDWRRHTDVVPDLRGEDLAARLRGSRLIAADGKPGLDFINLTQADLNSCNFSGTSLAGAWLSGANLRGSRFENATLRLADLTRADLQEANLSGADLTGAKLGRASFKDCKLDEANLSSADLVGADLTGSRFWRASMKEIISTEWEFCPHMCVGGEVTTIGDVLRHIREIKKHYTLYKLNEMPVFYFRGESQANWELAPSVMRKFKGNRSSLRNVESEMLVDLRSRRAEDFVEASSALDQMVIARHHFLPTRLLDITRNPLVALFNASEKPRECPDEERPDGGFPNLDGRIHVFAVPPSLVKQFDSDTVSVITNFARLRRREQNLILGKTREDTSGDVDPGYGGGSQLRDLYASAMNRLHQFIRLEKPAFQDRTDPKDLLRVIVVEPQKSFERIRAQSGAFLISAFHERFEEAQIRKWTNDLPIYHYSTLTVPCHHKNEIVEDLATLNITRETMLPGLDEAAEAVREYYRNLVLQVAGGS